MSENEENTCAAMSQSDHDILIAMERDLQHMLERLSSIETSSKDTLKRMNELEDQWSVRKGFLAGVVATVGFLGGTLGAFITYIFTKP